AAVRADRGCPGARTARHREPEGGAMNAGRRRRALHVFATFGAGGPQVRMTQLVQRMGGAWQHAVLALDGDLAAAAQLPAGAACELLPTPARRGFLGSMRAFQQLL